MNATTLGEMVREARKEQGITQPELSVHADVSLSLVRKIERGRDDLSLSSVLKVCSALGISVRCQSPLGEEIELSG